MEEKRDRGNRFFKQLSVEKIIKGNTLLLAVALLFALIAIWGYVIYSVRKESVVLTENMVDMIGTDLKSQMDRIDEYLVTLQLDNVSFQRLSTTEDEGLVFSDLKTLESEFDAQILSNPSLNIMMVHSNYNQGQYLTYGNMDSLTFPQQKSLKRISRDFFGNSVKEQQINYGEWSYIRLDSQPLLYKVIKYGNVYCTAIFHLDAVLSNYQNEEQLYTLFFCTPEQETISNKEISSGDILYAGQEFGPLRMGVVMQPNKMMGIGKAGGYGLVILTMVTVGLMVLAWMEVRAGILRPIDTLMNTMDDIRTGKKEFGTGADLVCSEFIQLGDTFNSMMLRIRTLQIEQYEKELEAQRFQLIHLQSQIRPHFYVNCLKNIYALAEQGQYERIKGALVALSDHLRYVFSANDTKVSLEQELAYLQNYAELYRYNFSKLILLNFDIADDVKEDKIPPITLLTFLENTIKYSGVYAKPIVVNISARHVMIDGKENLNITFKDNGQGFSEEALERLREEEPHFEQTGHVGTYNVIYRCRLLYPAGFQIYFLNQNGAVIEMYLAMGND